MRKGVLQLLVAACVLTQVSLCAALAGGTAAPAQPALAADFNLQDIDQVRFYTLSSHRDKQPVLLFFWTTWCPFCQKALKSLSMSYDEFKAKGLEVLAVNLGESASKVRDAVSYYKLPFTVLIDERSSTVDSYNLLGVPTYILIDRKGRIIFRDNYLPKNKLMELLKDA